MVGAMQEIKIKLVIIRINDIKVDKNLIGFQELNICADMYRKRFEGYSIGEVDRVQNARNLFRAIGLDPTKHRPSSEALLRRALKGKEFYSVNPLVDIGNWCSLDFLLPICVYDKDKIKGEIKVRLGKENETYLAHNNRVINLNGRYVIADDTGAFGSPITDSKRTAVDNNSRNTVLIIFAPQNYDPVLLEDHASIFAERVINICGGKFINIDIIDDM